MDYTLNQKLWYEPDNSYSSRRNAGHEVVVVKIGRKWVEVCRPDSPHMTMRVEKGKTAIDGEGYSSPGRLWPSKADADAHVELKKEWNSFYQRLNYAPPAEMTMEKLNELKKILGF